jgi:dTDP-4-dehydrorhamnose reductase
VIVITGSTGQLGTAFGRALAGSAVRNLSEEELDFRDLDEIPRALAALEPSVVINCAGYTAVDAAEEDEGTARIVNAIAVGTMAAACADIGARFVTFSTDYVFDGTCPDGYVESDQPNPMGAYGRTKLEGERLALARNPGSLVVRTSWLLSGTHPNFASTMMTLVGRGPVRVVDDQRGRPTLADDLARATIDAVERKTTGILHLANDGITTWFGLAREIAVIAGLDPQNVTACSTEEFARPAPRPANSVLNSERVVELGIDPLPPYQPGLAIAVRQLLASDVA